jgi:hypothetical protein
MRGGNEGIEAYEETDHCLPRTLFKPIISLLTPNQTDHFPPLTLIVAADYASVVGILWTTYQCFVSSFSDLFHGKYPFTSIPFDRAKFTKGLK